MTNVSRSSGNPEAIPTAVNDPDSAYDMDSSVDTNGFGQAGGGVITFVSGPVCHLMQPGCWTITPTLLSHFSIGGNKFFKNAFSPISGQNWVNKICIKNAVDCNVNFPNISFTEFTGWGTTTYNGTEQRRWSFKDDLSYIHGSHTLKFGYDFESRRANGFGQQNISGQATFSFHETAVPGATSATSGSSFASFLLGAADSGTSPPIRTQKERFTFRPPWRHRVSRDRN